MMFKIIFGILAISLVGCGRGTSVPVDSDSTFTPYVKAFDTASKAYGIPTAAGNISIQFQSLPVNTEAGMCYQASLTRSASIGIDKNEWDQMTESERTTLIFHELGHCILNQSHRPHSIMAPTILPGFIFFEHESEYIDELFTNSN